jgi:UDPglucose 6-dehydrogenase
MRGIRFFGLGKLGLPLAALFAKNGNDVLGIDTNERHINDLRAGKAGIDEPGLDELLQLAGRKLTYSTRAIDIDADISIIHVPTPSDKGNPGFSSAIVEQATETACRAAASASSSDRHLLIVASTLMPGALESRIKPIVARYGGGQRGFDLAYVPDFVAIGDVIRGFQSPTILVIGTESASTAERVEKLYRTILLDHVPVARLTLAEAELAKVAWNAYLCMKIDFANLIARLAFAKGDIDVDRVLDCLSRDSRVGRGFLSPGMPFGGPCLSRDADALVALCETLDCDSALGRGIRDANDEQVRYVSEIVLSYRPNRIAILGLGFKSGSDITDLSPSFMVMRQIASRRVAMSAYDPSSRARESLRAESWAANVNLCETISEALADADVALVAVKDARYASLASIASDTVTIIDPWACVSGKSPRLVQPGRGAVYRSFS